MKNDNRRLMMQRISLVLFLFCIGGCTDPQDESLTGMDRLVALAPDAIKKRFPDQDMSHLRLLRIHNLTKTHTEDQTYMLVFEDIRSITTTNIDGSRSRSVRHVDVHITSQGQVTSVGEGTNKATGRPGK